MRHIRSHLSYANVISTVCLFLLLSGGTAVALNGANSVQSDDLGPGSQVTAPDVAANAVNGSDVLNKSLGIADLAPAARGARAYARIGADGAPTRSKGIFAFTHFRFEGINCFKLDAGIDSASVMPVVGTDYFGDSTSANSERVSIAEWDSAAPDCDPGELEVRTFVYNSDRTDNNDGTGSGPGGNVVAQDEAFYMVVP